MIQLIESLRVSETTSMKEGFQKINETGKKILLVTGEKNKLTAIVTDSDLRKGIVGGTSLSAPLSEVMNTTFKSVAASDPQFKQKGKELMLKYGIEQIPVLNQSGEVVSLLLWTDYFGEEEKEALPNRVVIMAGGKGTRLDPFTKILPKALIPIGEDPIISRIINAFTKSGFRNVTISVNHKKEMIKNYFLENTHDIDLDWLEEETFQGTAGALKRMEERVSEPFFVTNCDVILDADYREILDWHVNTGRDFTLVGSYQEVYIPYGVVHINDGCLEKIEEKPRLDVLINCGFYIISPQTLKEIPDGVFDMDVFMRKLKEKGYNVGVFPVYSGWFDTGQWEEYKKTLKHFEEL